jgi:hypothetical protein
MEELELPAYIPKKEQALYRDGLIAGYAGKQLAAVFYLRCFIEQFARRQVGMLNKRKTGDEIMDAYAKLLPEEKRSLMPSLKDWYDKLSEPIHAADEEAAEGIFDTARQAIESHFDIRRVLGIPEVDKAKESDAGLTSSQL